jgi:hypothetical protein
MLTEQYLRQTAQRTIERINSDQCSEKDITTMISCLSEDQQQDFYLACAEEESHLIKKEIAIEQAWIDGDHTCRNELKHSRPAIKRRVQAAALLSQTAQTFSDHSVRGSIHYLNQFIKSN